LNILGHPKEALEHAEMALKQDPMNIGMKTAIGLNSYCAGRYNEAIKVFQEVLKIDPGNVGKGL
jgi:tetratricopeptide (TPR) repeat protein